MGCFARPVNNLRASHSRDAFEGLRDKKISVRSPSVQDVQTTNHSHFRQQTEHTALFCSGEFKGPLWKVESPLYRWENGLQMALHVPCQLTESSARPPVNKNGLPIANKNFSDLVLLNDISRFCLCSQCFIPLAHNGWRYKARGQN